jgi:hypothetical protein
MENTKEIQDDMLNDMDNMEERQIEEGNDM